MKQLYAISSFLCLAALLAASCTTSLTDEPDTTARAIAFSTPQAGTRAAVTSSAGMRDFSVWGGYDSSVDNVFNNETVHAQTWTYDGGTRYWIPEKTYNFYAVHPAGLVASVADDGTITVTDFDCSKTGSEAVDLMTATALRTTSNPIKDDETVAVPFQFKHALTRLTFSAKLADGLGNEYSLQVKEVALWASNKGTMTQDMTQANSQPVWATEPYLIDGDDESDIVNDEYNAYLYWLTTDNGALQSDPITAGNAVQLNVTGKGDLLVIPQKMNETRPVLAINYTLSYGGSTTSSIWKVYPLKGNTDWTPGASLNYTFTIDEDNAYFNISVGDWIDGNPGNENVEFN